MTGIDPTSLPHSLPAMPGRRWSIQDVADLQLRQLEVLSPIPTPAPRDGARPAADHPAEQTSISGRYRSAGNEQLELRIDMDGQRPTRRVSGDFFQRTGATLTYAGSFIVDTPAISIVGGNVIIEGEGVFSFASSAPRLRVTIPLAPGGAPNPPAIAQFLSSSGVPGAVFNCTFESPFFRSIEIERDIVGSDVVPFDSYDTSRLPSSGAARVLSVAAAYAEAGIEMFDSGSANMVPVDLAGPDRIWTDGELHNAMTEHFSEWVGDPSWRVYQLAATIHERGAGLRGIMFDSDRRQGCAVFHDVVGQGNDPNAPTVRAMLRTYVHELGHCFNLYHSHQKEFMDPPRPNRMDALSWMHYPDAFQSATGSGSGAYWRAFPFQFDDEELIHLRHGFRNSVIPGGDAFGIGAADVEPGTFAEPVRDQSGLALEIRGPAQYLLGTPVVVELKLYLTDLRGRTVNTALHPNLGFTQIGIAPVGGKTMVYRPIITHCAEPELRRLDPSYPSIYDSAYIGYGKDGFYFDSPGQYELRAIYHAPDGSKVVSNVMRIRIKPPLTREEDELADLFLGEEQGQLLYLLGSDSERLSRGRDAFQLAIDKFPKHPLASYAKLIEGMNASKRFKRIEKTKEGPSVKIRDADLDRSEALLSDLASEAMRGPEDVAVEVADLHTPQASAVPRLDNISLNMAVRRLAEVRKEKDDKAGAASALQSMFDFFAGQNVPNHVQDNIRAQIAPYVDGGNADGTGAASGRASRRPRPGSRRSS